MTGVGGGGGMSPGVELVVMSAIVVGVAGGVASVDCRFKGLLLSNDEDNL